MAKREIKRWITINGVHVPIYEGSSVKEAVNNFIDKVSNTKTIAYPKKGFKNKDAHLDKDEKTKQDQIKKSEEQKKQLNGEKSSIDSKLSKDIEAARNGDLTVRNSYIDRLNNINAKMASGRGNAKLMQEAKELREKVKAINDAYRESDKFKKEDDDWKAFQKEQAEKKAEREKARTIADVETLKDKEGLYNPKNIQEIVNKMDKYRDEHEKQSPHIKIGGKEYDTIPLMGDDGKPEGYSLIPQSGEGKSNPFLAKNGKVYDSSNAYTREKLGLDAENERVKAILREEKNKSNPAITGSGKAIDEAKVQKKSSVKNKVDYTIKKNAGKNEKGSYDYVSSNGEKGYSEWSAYQWNNKDKTFQVTTIHPYDDADRHWAKGKMVKFNSTSVGVNIYYKGKQVEFKLFKYSGKDHEATYNEIAKYLDDLDKKTKIKSRISPW